MKDEEVEEEHVGSLVKVERKMESWVSILKREVRLDELHDINQDQAANKTRKRKKGRKEKRKALSCAFIPKRYYKVTVMSETCYQ